MESFGKPVEKCPVTVTKIFVICFETVLLLIRLAFLFGAKVVTRIYDRVISPSFFFCIEGQSQLRPASMSKRMNKPSTRLADGWDISPASKHEGI